MNTYIAQPNPLIETNQKFRVEFSTIPTWRTPRNAEEKEQYSRQSNTGWQSYRCSIAELYDDHIRLGHPVTSVFKRNYRNQDNFLSSQMILIDLDEITSLSVEDVKRLDFFCQYAGIIYPSPSSTLDNPKTRIILPMERPITNADQYERVVQQILTHLDVQYGIIADWATTGAQTFFFGSDLPGAFVQEAMLPENVIEQLNYPPALIECLRRYRLREANDFKAGRITKAKTAALILFEAASSLQAIPPVESKPISVPALGQNEKAPERNPTTQKAREGSTLSIPTHDITGLDGHAVFALYIEDVKACLPPDAVAGKHVRCPNPHHVDEHPSFRINYDRNPEGQPMCSCGIQYQSKNWKTVGSWVGLDYGLWLSMQQRPDTVSQHPPTNDSNRLDNAFRQYLLQGKLPGVARVLDALLLHGYQPGQVFTQMEVLGICKPFGIGRKTIDAALKTELPIVAAVASGAAAESLAPVTSFSENAPQQTRMNFVPIFHRNRPGAIDTASQYCGKKGDKNRRGRPAQEFVMPNLVELGRRLSLQPEGSSPITSADLQSSKTYRATLIRERIRLSPGRYSKQSLSEPVGVSKRTVYNYIREDKHIEKEPQFDSCVITWDNVGMVDEIANNQPHGVYLKTQLEDGTKQKYKPTTAIAKHLLAQRKAVEIFWQVANFYRYVEQPDQESEVDDLPQTELAVSNASSQSPTEQSGKLVRSPEQENTSPKTPQVAAISDEPMRNWNDIPPDSDDWLNEEEISRIELEAMAEFELA